MRGKRRQRGSITVFVTLMLVPVVVITGMMVDVARLKMYSSQAVMAADAYGEAVLSEYDNLLKELYGLFSVTQNEEGLAALETFKEYAKYSFKPNADSKGLSGFMPYQDADVDLVWEKIDGASLSNSSVLMTQISDFMKYRIVEEVLGDGGEKGILETLEQFDKMNADMNAMEDRTDITDSSKKVLEEIDNYFQILEKINDYPAFIKIEEDRYKAYSSKLTEIAASSDYADYVYYLSHEEECQAALEKKNRIAAAASTEEGTEEELSEEEEKQADIASRLSNFAEEIGGMTERVQNEAKDFTGTGKLTDYDAVLRQISELETSAFKLDGALDELNNQVSQLKSELEGCTKKVKDGIREELKDLEDILALSDDFMETFDLIEPVNGDYKKSENNKVKMNQQLQELDTVLSNLTTGSLQPGDNYWAATISFDWYSFRQDKDAFYRELERICGGQKTGGKGDKDAGKKKQEEADAARQKAEQSLKQEDESTDARDIPSAVADELLASGSVGGSVPDLFSYFSGGLSFDAIGRAGAHLLDRFLVTTYDFGMFSSRVSGIKPEEEEGTSDSSEDYYDVSLTGYKMSKNINYLYGAELEYLLGGYNSSKENLNETRNIICGIRLTMNFVSTYTVDEVNDTINNIAKAAADAVAAATMGTGAAVAALVKVAVSGALRAAVSMIETAADWTALKNREKVTFMKKELDQLECIDDIAALLGGSITDGGGSSDKGLELDYEDYLYVLLCLMLDGDTLMSRTANLITLNVNQAQNSGDTLTALKFKMSKTVTAVKSTCKVKADFVVVPDNFMKMYLSGTKTQSLIEVLEDEYFGYSMIRGY